MTYSAPHIPTETSRSFAIPTPLPKHIEAFKALYHEKFGVFLSTEEAMEQLTQLVAIVRYKHDNTQHQLGQRDRQGRV